MGFESFSNHSVCPGNTRRNIAFRFTLNIKDSSTKYWHFSPRIDFGRGGAVFVNGTEKVKYENDMWYPRDTNASKLDFSVQINGEATIKI